MTNIDLRLLATQENHVTDEVAVAIHTRDHWRRKKYTLILSEKDSGYRIKMENLIKSIFHTSV